MQPLDSGDHHISSPKAESIRNRIVLNAAILVKKNLSSDSNLIWHWRFGASQFFLLAAFCKLSM
jgi:hypothetical protein